jgi:hypothetical protein
MLIFETYIVSSWGEDIMRFNILNSTNFFSFYQKASSMFAKNNLLKRFLYQLGVNFLPTILMLIFFGIIAMYFSGIIERANLRSNDFKPAYDIQKHSKR